MSGDGQAAAGESQAMRDGLRIVWRFALLVAVFSMFIYLDEAALDNAVMTTITETSAAGIEIVLRAVGVNVTTNGSQVSYRDTNFEVTPECTGYEVLELFSAAVIAAPVPWAFRLRGLAMGLSILTLINFGRMLSLVFFSVHWPQFHDLGHLYTWPVIIITVALGLWLTWINDAYARMAPADEGPPAEHVQPEDRIDGDGTP
ncbi:MAG: hypothetical protein GY733_09195 [bacterium]|nr:hypothetical protein [bacterium]